MCHMYTTIYSYALRHIILAYKYILVPTYTLLVQLQKQTLKEKEKDSMSSVRLSHELKLRLAKLKARLLLKEGRDLSMEELIKMLVDEHEEKENE